MSLLRISDEAAGEMGSRVDQRRAENAQGGGRPAPLHSCRFWDDGEAEGAVSCKAEIAGSVGQREGELGAGFAGGRRWRNEPG